MSNPSLAEISAEIEDLARTATNQAALQRFTVDLIARRLPSYNWVGFYMLDSTDPEMLVLGEFAGAPTEHTRIPISRGICGAAVAQEETIVVDDVRSDPRYLACSIETRSEIVVPIRAHGRIVGEIDIDSHEASAFGPEDRAFLEHCASLIGAYLEGTTSLTPSSPPSVH